ncbi:hypothetical protein CP533_1883 [Ophiocordyceps camponoti-saundersi (nom. inval.)]|nr:hypothetical protein CP533_1883 [Ophiocordyceps camponoti-saundersi (nom. inval.)]
MADFLASFNLGSDDGAQQPQSACASIDDLQLRLQELLLSSGTTAERVNHVCANLEISANAQLTVSLSPAENSVLEGLSNLDPSLGGLNSSSVAADNQGELTMRSLRATDALKNQPEDDPVLQRAIANLIVSTVSNTDGSSWAMDGMSLSDGGWNFAYLCMESSHHWDLLSKGKTRNVVGDYTLREPDPILMSRPAFDCRGAIKVCFFRDSQSIMINFDHTPFHKTVAEVLEYFKPPPRPIVAPLAQRTPKKQGSTRKKRESTKAPGENSKPRKRKKTDTQPQDTPAAPAHEQQPLAEISQVSNGTTQGGFVDGLAPDTDTAAKEGQGPPSQVSAIPLNLSPEESARRREVATKLLSDAGVDPDTLSTEQFNIFANQSPELQKESLNMLVKYGAERLRIVHPSNRDSSASVPPATPTQAIVPASSEPAEVAAPSSAPANAKTKALSKSVLMKKFRTPGKSRKACTQCKSRKVKCPRERPTCVECQTQGLTCEYEPSKPRAKKPKSEPFAPAGYDVEDEPQISQAPAEVTLETEEEPVDDSQMAEAPDERAEPEAEDAPGDDADAQEDEHAQGEEAQEPEEEEEEAQAEVEEEGEGDEEEEEEEEAEEAHEDAEDLTGYSSYPQVPVSDMLAPSVDVTHHETQLPAPAPYFRSASGLALPQPEQPALSQQLHAANEHEMMMPQGTEVHYQSQMATADVPSSSQQNAEHPIDLLTSPQQRSKGPRHSLPTGPPLREPDEAPPAPTAVAGWSGVANSSLNVTAGSPAMRRSEVDVSGSRGTPQMQDVMAISQAALEHHRQAHSTPTAIQPSHRSTLSHSANDSRMKSRLGQRPSVDGFQSLSLSNSNNNNARYRSSGLPSSNAPAFNAYSNYSEEMANNNNQSADRIGYEPYSYQRSSQSTSSYPAYDYSRSQPSSSTTTATTATTATAATSVTTPTYPFSNPNNNNNLGLANSNMSGSRGGHVNTPSRTASPYDLHNARRPSSQASAPVHDTSTSSMRNSGQWPRSSSSHGQPPPQSQQQQPQMSHSLSQRQDQQSHHLQNRQSPHSLSHLHHQQQRQQHQHQNQGHQQGGWYGSINNSRNHNNSNSSSSSSYPFGVQRSNPNF